MHLKKYITLVTVLIFSICFIMPSTVLAEGESKEPLTIDAALQKAYKTNPDLRKAELEVEKAQIQRDDAADLLPFIPAGGLVSPKFQQLVNGYQLADIQLGAKKRARNQTKDGVTQAVITAYSNAIIDHNKMEFTRLILEDQQQQMKARSAAKAVGLMANFNYEKSKTKVKELEEDYKASQSDYEGKVAALRSLLGEGKEWNPELTSQAILTNYERADLTSEISRGLSNAVPVWSSKAVMDMERSRETWIIPGLSSDMQNVNTGLAEADYEKAKRDSKAIIEQGYYSIDALEGKIDAAELAYETAKKDLELGQLKYEVGMIPLTSIDPTNMETLSALRLQEEQARVQLESLKAGLASAKAQFALFTGQTVYDPADWNSPGVEEQVNK